ncbi:SixA phosphatase family protein [Desulfosarcina ovata]|uniref:Phosphohistidine phosphatase SixA n=1 Tax=Desulfosarcina ovata subsp. ovata TaxID=2752305 RepID=A0A5K8AK22_9BACT|nr:histidine phosphatase family protein [Desulfosarcina ovata]BBO93031.1 phosphohistidine phosphatase SixA [Desulfosarcina ovata subsp. ovata]
MKTLHIMRHAKSSWKDAGLKDHQRPLNKRGKRAAADMGERFRGQGMAPDLLLSSDARRAMDTAEIICHALDLAPSIIIADSLLYLASANRIEKMVRKLDDCWCRVILFGHNPGLTELVNRFYPTPIANLPTAGVVGLTFDIRRWRDLRRKRLVRSVFDFPKNKADA